MGDFSPRRLGTAVARARYRPGGRLGVGHDTTKFSDYTIVNSLTRSDHVRVLCSWSLAQRPDLIRTWEKVANTLISGSALDMAAQYGVFGQWQQAGLGTMLPVVRCLGLFAPKPCPMLNLNWGPASRIEFRRSRVAR